MSHFLGIGTAKPELLHCSYYTEKMTFHKKSLALSKVSAVIQEFMGGRGQHNGTTVLYSELSMTCTVMECSENVKVSEQSNTAPGIAQVMLNGMTTCDKENISELD